MVRIGFEAIELRKAKSAKLHFVCRGEPAARISRNQLDLSRGIKNNRYTDRRQTGGKRRGEAVGAKGQKAGKG